MRTWRRTARILLLASLALALAQAVVAQRSNNQADVAAAINSGFGAAVEIVNAANPFYATGDFNGDNQLDLIVLVRVRGANNSLPGEVRVLNPYGYDEMERRAGTNRPPPALALAIIHGGAGGWGSASPPQAKILLRGNSNVLLTEDESVTNTTDASERRTLMSVWRRGARRRPSYLPRTARGDAIMLQTQAAEALLYWDGRTYRYAEDPSGA